MGHEVEGGNDIGKAAGIGEAEEAVLEGLELGVFGECDFGGKGDGGNRHRWFSVRLVLLSLFDSFGR